MSSKFNARVAKEESERCVVFANAISTDLPDALEMAGITLLGFAVKYDGWECLLTLKGDIGGTRSVAFVGSNSVMNAVMSALTSARADRLRWREDHYKPSKA